MDAEEVRRIASNRLIQRQDHVRAVQQFAADIGIGIAVDGDPGLITRRVCMNLQKAMCLGPYLLTPLRADGQPGQYTTAALEYSRTNGFRCSTNFTFMEFMTKGSRVASGQNPVLWAERNLVILAQAIRESKGPFTPISAYRDPAHNARVGGATNSTHMRGLAIDVPSSLLKLTEAQARQLGAHGVGIVRATGWVAHVDVRGYSARWFY